MKLGFLFHSWQINIDDQIRVLDFLSYLSVNLQCRVNWDLKRRVICCSSKSCGSNGAAFHCPRTGSDVEQFLEIWCDSKTHCPVDGKRGVSRRQWPGCLRRGCGNVRTECRQTESSGNWEALCWFMCLLCFASRHFLCSLGKRKRWWIEALACGLLLFPRVITNTDFVVLYDK